MKKDSISHAVTGILPKMSPAATGKSGYPPSRAPVEKKNSPQLKEKGAANGAGNEIRTRYLHLGKVALCQMSYARITNICYYSRERQDVKSFFCRIMKKTDQKPSS